MKGFVFVKMAIVDMFSYIPRDGLLHVLRILLIHIKNRLKMKTNHPMQLIFNNLHRLSYPIMKKPINLYKSYSEKTYKPQGGLTSICYI